MTAYDVVFSKEASTRYMQKDASIGSIIKGIAKGIQRARSQRIIAKNFKKQQHFKALEAARTSQANALRASSDATMNAAVAKSGLSNLMGNIKGSQQAGKADYLQELANDARKASVRRQMAIEKQLVAQGATKEQARAITRNVNAQKYLQYGDADGAMKLQAVRDRRLQAVADGRARQQAAQAAAQQAAQTTNNTLNGGGGFQVTLGNAPGIMSGSAGALPQVTQPSAQVAAQAAKPATQAAAAQAAVQAAAKAVAANRARQRAAQAAAQAASKATKPTAKAAKPTAKAAKPAAQATQPAAQAANNALNGGGGFQVTLQ